MQAPRLILIVIALVFWLTGCAGAVWIPFEISAPRTIPRGFAGTVDGDGRATLHLQGLDMRFEARNGKVGGVTLGHLMGIPVPYPAGADYDQEELPNLPLMIFFDFMSEEEGYAFNPMAVQLAREGTDALLTSAYIGPGRTQPHGYSCHDPQGEELERSTESQAFDLVPGEERTCFVLVFDTPSSADIPFRLTVSGLSRGGEPILAPDLHFARLSVRSFDGPREWRPALLYP
jgi:hypothetical protein